MKKTQLIVGVLLMSTLFASGCTNNQNKKNSITVLEDTKNVAAAEVMASKIDTYENMVGNDWINEENILITKINNTLDPVKIDNEKLKADFDIKNLFSYNLDTKTEKGIGDQAKFQDSAIISPNRQYIFYQNEFEKIATGYITDLQGNTKVQILDKDIDEYDLSEANWINDKEIIVPCHNIKGFALINIDGNIEKIKDVETGIMGTQDPLNGLSMTDPLKISDKIYYKTLQSDTEEHNKLKVYDITTKEKRNLLEDEVIEFGIFPDRKHLFVIAYNPKKEINELRITDLEGNKSEILIEDWIFGARVSADGSKVAYIKNEQGREGVYIIDIKTKKEYLAASGEYYIPISWSPSGNKIMVHGRKTKENSNPYDEIDITHIIKL